MKHSSGVPWRVVTPGYISSWFAESGLSEDEVDWSVLPGCRGAKRAKRYQESPFKAILKTHERGCGHGLYNGPLVIALIFS